MDWFLAAIISAVMLSGQGLMFQQLQKYYPINTFMIYAFMGSALVLSVLFLRPEDFPAIGRNIVPLVLSGIGSLAGNYAYNRAIRLQPNIGYIESVMSWRLIVTYLFSIVALNASFEVVRLGGVVLIALGVIAVSGAYTMNRKDIRLDWLNWALFGGLSFAMLTILVRIANDDGVRGEVSLIIVLLVAGVGFLFGALRDKSALTIYPKHIGLYLAVILFAVVGNGALFVAYAKTPNLAYAIAIDNSRIIILYLIGLVLYSEQWQSAKAVGIALSFVGILLLS